MTWELKKYAIWYKNIPNMNNRDRDKPKQMIDQYVSIHVCPYPCMPLFQTMKKVWLLWNNRDVQGNNTAVSKMDLNKINQQISTMFYIHEKLKSYKLIKTKEKCLPILVISDWFCFGIVGVCFVVDNWPWEPKRKKEMMETLLYWFWNISLLQSLNTLT